MPLEPSASPAIAFKVNGAGIRGFILRFTGIMLVLAFIPFIPGWDTWVERYMRFLTIPVNALLQWFGQPVRIADNHVFSDTFSMILAPRCAALDVLLFYCAIVLAFPAPALRKLWGVVAGLVVISALNVVRIVSIYLIGVNWPDRVQETHEWLWPVLLIAGTLVLCTAWLCLANARRKP